MQESQLIYATLDHVVVVDVGLLGCLRVVEVIVVVLQNAARILCGLVDVAGFLFVVPLPVEVVVLHHQTRRIGVVEFAQRRRTGRCARAHVVGLAGDFDVVSHLLKELDGTDALAVVPGTDHDHAVELFANLDNDLVAQQHQTVVAVRHLKVVGHLHKKSVYEFVVRNLVWNYLLVYRAATNSYQFV